jgi:predicted transcriptional regulator
LLKLIGQTIKNASKPVIELVKEFKLSKLCSNALTKDENVLDKSDVPSMTAELENYINILEVYLAHKA